MSMEERSAIRIDNERERRKRARTPGTEDLLTLVGLGRSEENDTVWLP